MMRRLVCILTGLACVITAHAASSVARDLDISVTLNRDGAAFITERWNIYAAEGTEMYLNREDLGNMEISSFSVKDNGVALRNIGEWNVNASFEAKAGKCGIVHKRGGLELCWGLGSYGEHEFEVSYLMTGCVEACEDYDFLHIQFVSPGVSPTPRQVRLSIGCGTPLSTENARIWGFGFDGNAGFNAGSIIYESEGTFTSRSSIIALVRFDKGIFSPSNERGGSFQAVLDRALEGADFGEGGDDDERAGIITLIVMGLLFIGIPIGAAAGSKAITRKNILGSRKPDIQWFRDVPMDGDLEASYYILEKLGEVRKDNSLASAMILRMIHRGVLSVSKDRNDRIEISFNDAADVACLSMGERSLLDMMKAASGSDRILQHKEFSRWSGRHTSQVNSWVSGIGGNAVKNLNSKSYAKGTKFQPEGQRKARETLGFKKFLEDFTLSKERTTVEVNVWQEYLVFASLFGIADKVAKELRDINPQAFDEMMPYDYTTTRSIINSTDALSRSITNARAAHQAAQAARSGMGGHTSFGGGGGFHGGGMGGGIR